MTDPTREPDPRVAPRTGPTPPYRDDSGELIVDADCVPVPYRGMLIAVQIPLQHCLADGMSDPVLEDIDAWHAWYPETEPTLAAMRRACEQPAQSEIERLAENEAVALQFDDLFAEPDRGEWGC